MNITHVVGAFVFAALGLGVLSWLDSGCELAWTVYGCFEDL